MLEGSQVWAITWLSLPLAGSAAVAGRGAELAPAELAAAVAGRGAEALPVHSPGEWHGSCVVEARGFVPAITLTLLQIKLW